MILFLSDEKQTELSKENFTRVQMPASEPAAVQVEPL